MWYIIKADEKKKPNKSNTHTITRRQVFRAGPESAVYAHMMCVRIT